MARPTKETELPIEAQLQIRQMRKAGVPYSIIQKRYPVSRQNIWDITTKRTLPELPDLPRIEVPEGYNGDEIIEVDLLDISLLLWRWRPVVPPQQAHIPIPLPAWSSLQIARRLYDEGIITREEYSNWLTRNTPERSATNEQGATSNTDKQ